MLRTRTNNVCECFSQSNGQFYISSNPWFFNQNLSAPLYKHSRARLCVKSPFHDSYVSSSRVWEATPQMVFTVFKYIHPPSPNLYIKWSSRTPFSASILPMTLGFMRFWASLIKVPFLLEWKASSTIVSHLCNLSGVLFNHYNKREKQKSQCTCHQIALELQIEQRKEEDHRESTPRKAHVYRLSKSFPSSSSPGENAFVISEILSRGSSIARRWRIIRTSFGTNLDMLPLATLYKWNIISFTCPNHILHVQ